MINECHPPHIYQDNTIYFITARTKGSEYIFNTHKKCGLFFDVFEKSLDKFDFETIGWVLNKDHYHILIRVSDGRLVGRFINNLHANITRLLNKIECTEGRKIWYQYWDRCIRSERDLYIRLNYIHHNPVKHGLVLSMDDYEFSSYRNYLANKGGEWLRDCFDRYSISDFTLEEKD
jgi:putative transposase